MAHLAFPSASRGRGSFPNSYKYAFTIPSAYYPSYTSHPLDNMNFTVSLELAMGEVYVADSFVLGQRNNQFVSSWSQPQKRVIPQESYTSPTHTTSPVALSGHPIMFSVNGNPGVRVVDALEDKLEGLANGNQLLTLPELIGVKITVRISVGSTLAFHLTSILTLNY